MSNGSAGPNPRFIPCRNDHETSDAVTIGPAGGSVTLNGHRLDVPAGAVTQDVRFTITVLPAAFLKVRIEADGKPNFDFQVPASLTLSFARCAPADPNEPLGIFKIDLRNDAVLKRLGGEVDRQAQTITAKLDGLSGYSVGTPP